MIEEDFRSDFQKKIGWKKLNHSSRGFKYFISFKLKDVVIIQVAPTLIYIKIEQLNKYSDFYKSLMIQSKDRNFIKVLMNIVTCYIKKDKLGCLYGFMEEEESLDLDFENIINYFYEEGFAL